MCDCGDLYDRAGGTCLACGNDLGNGGPVCTNCACGPFCSGCLMCCDRCGTGWYCPICVEPANHADECLVLDRQEDGSFEFIPLEGSYPVLTMDMLGEKNAAIYKKYLDAGKRYACSVRCLACNKELWDEGERVACGHCTCTPFCTDCLNPCDKCNNDQHCPLCLNPHSHDCQSIALYTENGMYRSLAWYETDRARWIEQLRIRNSSIFMRFKASGVKFKSDRMEEHA